MVVYVTAYTFSPTTRQYKTKRGKIVAASVILGLRDALADATANEAADLTTAYLAGAATLTNWADRFAALLGDAVLAGYLLGRGGSNVVTPADDAKIAGTLAPHLDAAKGFTADLAAADKPLLDDAGAVIDPSTLSVDENGDVVDENGDPVMVDGQALTADGLDALGAAWGGVTALLARAASYGTAAYSGYSTGQSAAWDGAELPEMPPRHPGCACSVAFRVADDGQILGTWTAQASACAVCDSLAGAYQDYETGVYTSPDNAGQESEGA